MEWLFVWRIVTNSFLCVRKFPSSCLTTKSVPLGKCWQRHLTSPLTLGRSYCSVIEDTSLTYFFESTGQVEVTQLLTCTRIVLYENYLATRVIGVSRSWAFNTFITRLSTRNERPLWPICLNMRLPAPLSAKSNSFHLDKCCALGVSILETPQLYKTTCCVWFKCLIKK